MSFLDTLARLPGRLIRFTLWLLAGLLGLAVLSLGLGALLVWMLVNRLRGRPMPLQFIKTRFADLRHGGAFGAGPAAGRWWPRTPAAEGGDSPAAGASPLARRMGRAGAVEDVQARDLPPGPSA